MSKPQVPKKLVSTQPQIQFSSSPQYITNIGAASTTQMSQISPEDVTTTSKFHTFKCTTGQSNNGGY